MPRRVSHVSIEKHTARTNWTCAICRGRIKAGEPFRYVFFEERKTGEHACIDCTDPFLKEQTIEVWSRLTGKPVEEVRRIWEVLHGDVKDG